MCGALPDDAASAKLERVNVDPAATETNDHAAPASIRSIRPAPLLVAGNLVTLIGFLTPWYRDEEGFLWSHSGWTYLSNSSGPGWPVAAVIALVVGVAASLAGRDPVARRVAVVGGIAGVMMSTFAVAAAFGATGAADTTNDVLERPVGIGMFLLALGAGLIVAGATERPEANHG